MELERIKNYIDNGIKVCISNDGYEVVKGKNGEYLIKSYFPEVDSQPNYIGLTWKDGKTPNYDPSEVYLPI